MVNIPCSKECLKYPICKAAIYVDCIDLSIYYTTELNRTTKTAGEILSCIIELLPNLEQIRVVAAHVEERDTSI